MFSVKQYVYQMRCRPTDQRYIGSTHYFPTGRWYGHWLNCKQKKANKLLQAAYEAHPSLVDWEFSVLEEISPRIKLAKLYQREAFWILTIPESLRLNFRSGPIITAEKYMEVLRRLATGVRYVDVRDQLGISMGMISKINRRYQLESLETGEVILVEKKTT